MARWAVQGHRHAANAASAVPGGFGERSVPRRTPRVALRKTRQADPQAPNPLHRPRGYRLRPLCPSHRPQRIGAVTPERPAGVAAQRRISAEPESVVVPFSPAVKNGSVLDNGVPFGQTGPIGSSRSLIRPDRSARGDAGGAVRRGGPVGRAACRRRAGRFPGPGKPGSVAGGTVGRAEESTMSARLDRGTRPVDCVGRQVASPPRSSYDPNIHAIPMPRMK
jgi:hypothetical protein